MSDTELLRHEATWRGFTTTVKYVVAFLVILLAILAWTLV
jgi:hypothetical protein